jgi:hypothetical protein
MVSDLKKVKGLESSFATFKERSSSISHKASGIPASERLTIKPETKSLRLRFTFTQYNVLVKESEHSTVLQQIQEASSSQVIRNLGNLLETGCFSDFDIETSDGKGFKVHKNVLFGMK